MTNNLLDDQFSEKEYFENNELEEIRTVRDKADALIGKIKSARVILFILSGLSVINIVLLFRQEGDNQSILTFTCFVVAVFLLLGLLTSKSPKIALSLALSIYLLMTILGIIGGEALGAGILIRLLVIYFLGQGTIAAFNLHPTLQRLQSLGVPKYWLAKAKKLQSLPTTRELR